MLPGLRHVRENAGLSIRQLEEKTVVGGGKKVYRSTISDLELAVHGAQPRTAKRLADVLGVSVEDLRHGE